MSGKQLRKTSKQSIKTDVRPVKLLPESHSYCNSGSFTSAFIKFMRQTNKAADGVLANKSITVSALNFVLPQCEASH